jgi:hypothetical protein
MDPAFGEVGLQGSVRPLVNSVVACAVSGKKLSNKLRNTRNVETTVQSELWKCRGGVQ